MLNKKWWSASGMLMAILICGTVATPAHAFHWFWQKKAAPAVSQANPIPAATPAANAAPAVQASAPHPSARKTGYSHCRNDERSPEWRVEQSVWNR